MKVQQGTLPLSTSLGLSKDKADKVIGIYFAKESNFLPVFIALIGIIVSLLILFYGNGLFAFLSGISFTIAFIFSTAIVKKREEASGIKYSLDQIDSLKIIDNTSMMASQKTTAGSLGGAAVGGVLLGGAGAIVGAISSGNNQTKEQVVNVGIKFKDKNWTVVRFELNETVLGKAHKTVLTSLLEATSQQQECPF
jgi:hypothetical protein